MEIVSTRPVLIIPPELWMPAGSEPTPMIPMTGIRNMMILFSASYYRQLSADTKMESFKIKNSFITFIFILIFVEHCL